ncbi:hypothetical protein [Planktomarina sp.]|jgi:hypothetical protein|uniref:hypothetical protein n=1 Tax=Planktomarina sp. TaxID=2024851 RepID=UPI003260D942
MFTVELEYDYALIRTLDEQDRYEDVEVVIGDEGEVFILQFNESTQKNSVIAMSLQQLVDLYAAMDSPEGLFGLEVKSGKQ